MSVPIISMTSNTSLDDVKTYLEAGMSGHIGKPVDFDEILHVISGELKTI